MTQPGMAIAVKKLDARDRRDANPATSEPARAASNVRTPITSAKTDMALSRAWPSNEGHLGHPGDPLSLRDGDHGEHRRDRNTAAAVIPQIRGDDTA
jgi:hypothetical protein